MASRWIGAAAVFGASIHFGSGAGAFENDYAALFAAHEAEVMQAEPGVRRLELPGPVIVSAITAADGSLRHVGVDQSGLGAAGCTYHTLVQVVVAAGLCPGTLSPTESATLDAHLEQAARFMAANGFPPVPAREARPQLLDDLRALSEQYTSEGALQCPDGDTGVQDWAEMARNLARPGGRAAIERALSLPRLPVMNPCL
jgi:hypothetical protein